MFKEIAHSLSGIKNLMIHPHKQAEQIVQLNRLYATLSRINHIIVRVSERNELFQQICDACITYGEFRMAWIGILDDKQILQPVAYAGIGTDYLTRVNIIVRDDSRGRGPIGRSVKEEKCIFCQDIATDPMMIPWRDEALKKGFRALASVPIRQNSVIIGTFSVYASEPMAFDDKQLKLIDEIGIDISFALDIFEKEKGRKNAEMELIKAKEKAEANETQFRLLLENAPQPIFIQIDKKFAYLNKAALSLYGASSGTEIINTYISDRAHPDFRNIVKDRIQEITTSKKHIKNMELKHLRLDNAVIDVEVSAVPILFNTQEGALVFVKDITERKKAECLLQEKNKEIESQNEEYRIMNEILIKTTERAEESDRLKTAFLQNMSHEIRTPMNAIMGFSNLLKDNFDNKAKLEKFARIINQRCNDLLNIINDILDIAKIESGQVSVSFEECNTDDLFEELNTFFAEYQERLGKQHIKLILNCCCDPKKLIIYTDKVKLKQIFINLLTNALKFTEEGIIEGGCKFENGNLWFFVSDTGIGIPADKQEQVFERFIQLNPSAGEFTGGTGLGLPIVKGLVNLLGGKIILHSEPGKGSTFLFTVSHEAVQHEKTNHAEPIIYNNKTLSDKTVLIVEDDEFNAEFIKEVLSYTGAKVLMAENGFKAINLCETFPVDLILLDIQLPDMNGYEVHEQIQKIKPHLKTIIQTAYASPDEKTKAMGKGCTDYISKPMEKDALLSMLNKHLQE